MDDQVRVLFVDDDPSALATTTEYLERQVDDLEMVEETDPTDVLDRLESTDVDCIVSDYKMPGRNGIELLTEVREEYPTLPFIFYTGRGSETVASEAISRDATDYVRKSVDTEDFEVLINRIRTAIDRRKERLSYRELFERVSVGIVVYDIETFERIEMNQAYCDMLGYDREHLEDLDIDDLTAFGPGYSNGAAREQFVSAVDHEASEFEWPYQGADGEVVWTVVSVEIADILGEERLLATIKDVTERKQREREMERQNDLFTQAQEIANVGVWEANIETATAWWSDQACRIYGVDEGYEPDPGEGIEYFHPEDRDRIQEAFDRALVEGEPYDLEGRIRDENGEEKWVRILGVPQIGGGDVARIRGTVQDITDRKERERQLENVKERLDLAVEGANLGVWDWDKETGALAVNDQWAEIIGIDAAELASSFDEWIEKIHPDDRDEVTDRIDAHEEGEARYYDMEYRVRTGEDSWTWVHSIGHVVDRDEDGEPVRAVGIHMKIDARKQYERQLKQQRDNLETLNEMVRHDIRNDLQLVMTYLEILDDHVDEEGREYLETALESAHTATELTETARELAEAMLQADSERYPVSLRGTLHREIEDVRSTEEQALIRMDGEAPQVHVLSNDMLSSVFRNLLKNAIQHNDADLPEVEVRVTLDRDTAIVEIADNGPGIPDEQKDEIFAKGERGLQSEGTGIGLYLVETLIDRYDGDVWVEDNEPRGAVFGVELPVADGTEA